jgi:hypothetical protein
VNLDDIKLGQRVLTPDCGEGEIDAIGIHNPMVHVIGIGWYWPCDLKPAPRTYTREDLIRVVVGQQWAVAIALHDGICFVPEWFGGDTWVEKSGQSRRIADLPCAVDVVDGKS